MKRVAAGIIGLLLCLSVLTPSHAAQSTDEPVDCAKAKCIAITYDDGPGPHTKLLLRILKKADAPATFFVLGSKAEKRPKIIRRAHREGHEIANHSWGHRQLTRMSRGAVGTDLKRTNKVLRNITGEKPRLMRPPYGSQNQMVRDVAKKRKLAVVTWDVDTNDWRHRSASRTRREAVKSARRGSIILMHDIHPSTVSATRGIIRDLRKKGFTLVRVSDLIAAKPGRTYCSQKRKCGTWD